MTTEQAPSIGIRTNGREREEAPPGSVAELYRAALPALDFLTEQTKLDVALIVRPEDVHTVLAAGLREPDLSMTLLRNMTAVDWEEEGLEIVYHLFSLRHHHGVAIKAMLEANDPRMQSATDLFRTAEWMEREAREMFGIEFEGLADTRNLLLDEDIDIHPLRKSHPLAEIEIKQGVEVDEFTKAHPPPKREDEEAAKKRAAAAAAAAAQKTERKPAEEMTEEELAERKAAQAERVQRARELAAARRAEGPPSKMRPRDESGAAAAAAEAPAEAEEAEAAPEAEAPAAAPRRPQPAAPAGGGEGSLTPEQKAERVQRARELAAARRAELRKERGE